MRRAACLFVLFVLLFGTASAGASLLPMDPDIEVNPEALSAEQCPDEVTIQTLQICNVGGGELSWSLYEATPKGLLAGSMPFIPVKVTGQDAAPAGLAASSPAPEQVKPAPPSDPEWALWDQPLSSVNQNAYVDQEFPDYPEFSSFLADDFTNGESWWISTIFVPGNGWNGFSTLFNATALTWQIYADNGGVPAGDPSGGGSLPIWTLTLAPTDPQVTISNGSGGMPSDVTASLAMPLVAPAGHWWLVFYPTMPFSDGGQFGRQPADTTNGHWGQFVNPGGGFGYGTAWQSWAEIGATQQDIAFRLEGCCPPPNPLPWLSEDPFGGAVPAGGCQDVAVAFDSTGLVPGDQFGRLLIDSNDPDEPTVTVPVHLAVVDCADNFMHINKMKMNWRLAGQPGYVKVIALVRIYDQDFAPVVGAEVFGDWTYPDGNVVPGAYVLLTDDLGRTRFRVKEPQFAEYQFCVTGMTLAGYVYDPGANEVPACVSAVTVP